MSDTPHSLEAEQAVLGAMMISSEAADRTMTMLRSEDFFRKAHSIIYEAIVELVEKKSAVDILTVSSALEQHGALDDAGGKAYIAKLTDGVPQSSNVASYASIVREKADLRRVMRSVSDVERKAKDGDVTAAHLAGETITNVLSVLGQMGGETSSVSDAAALYLQQLDDLDAQTYLTGYCDVDNILGGGIRTGALTIIAARPSVGKTSFSLKVAENIARRGVRVGFVSLEMTIAQLAGRVLCWSAGIGQADLESGRVEDMSALGESVTGLDDLPMVFDEHSGTVSEVGACCRRWKRQPGGLGCVVIDYLQLLAPDRRHSSVNEEVRAISRALKRLAQDEGIAVIALSQLSRAPEGRRDKRPHLADLRDSGALEQDADTAILLFREEMHGATFENEGVAEVIIAKNRLGGRTGTAKMRFDKRLAQFQTLAREWENADVP